MYHWIFITGILILCILLLDIIISVLKISQSGVNIKYIVYLDQTPRVVTKCGDGHR